jgi:hypothetical protein
MGIIEQAAAANIQDCIVHIVFSEGTYVIVRHGRSLHNVTNVYDKKVLVLGFLSRKDYRSPLSHVHDVIFNLQTR